jgi:hypothetical protein
VKPLERIGQEIFDNGMKNPEVRAAVERYADAARKAERERLMTLVCHYCGKDYNLHSQINGLPFRCACVGEVTQHLWITRAEFERRHPTDETEKGA